MFHGERKIGRGLVRWQLETSGARRRRSSGLQRRGRHERRGAGGVCAQARRALLGFERRSLLFLEVEAAEIVLLLLNRLDAGLLRRAGGDRELLGITCVHRKLIGRGRFRRAAWALSPVGRGRGRHPRLGNGVGTGRSRGLSPLRNVVRARGIGLLLLLGIVLDDGFAFPLLRVVRGGGGDHQALEMMHRGSRLAHLFKVGGGRIHDHLRLGVVLGRGDEGE